MNFKELIQIEMDKRSPPHYATTVDGEKFVVKHNYRTGFQEGAEFMSLKLAIAVEALDSIMVTMDASKQNDEMWATIWKEAREALAKIKAE